MSGLASTRGETNYGALRQGVTEALEAGKERARQAVESVRVATYSQVGEMIHTHVLAHKDRADYGERVVGRLAEDVGLSKRLLYDALRVFRTFGIVHTRAQLGWSHYRVLMTLPDQTDRRAFRRAAMENEWSVRELESQVKNASRRDAEAQREPGANNSSEAGEKRLVAKRGELRLYRVQEEEGLLSLDAGFKDGPPLSEKDAVVLQPGDMVRAIKDGRAGHGYRLERTDARKRNYTYAATVHRIIDGDTLWARIDFGVNWISRKKLRLRRIDSPELKTDAGERAKVHLEEVLREAQPFVVTTTRVDLYDRYLSDLFVMPGEKDLRKVAREGRFLNRELIEKGFARRWTKEKPPEF